MRTFFQEKGFKEVPTQSRLSILAACENPHSITTFYCCHEYVAPSFPDRCNCLYVLERQHNHSTECCSVLSYACTHHMPIHNIICQNYNRLQNISEVILYELPEADLDLLKATSFFSSIANKNGFAHSGQADRLCVCASVMVKVVFLSSASAAY